MVLAPDHPRLLSLLAGACAGAGANIADAQIFTMSDGRALDVMVLNREFVSDEDEIRRAQRICDNIAKLLQGSEMPANLIAQRKPLRKTTLFPVKPRVSVDNDLSNQFSVIEVEGLDRPGLLSDVTGAISDLNLDIRSAHISTYGEKVVDVFYVTDLIGTKITSETRIERIEARLTRVLESSEGEVSSSVVMSSPRAFGIPHR